MRGIAQALSYNILPPGQLFLRRLAKNQVQRNLGFRQRWNHRTSSVATLKQSKADCNGRNNRRTILTTVCTRSPPCRLVLGSSGNREEVSGEYKNLFTKSFIHQISHSKSSLRCQDILLGTLLFEPRRRELHANACHRICTSEIAAISNYSICNR